MQVYKLGDEKEVFNFWLIFLNAIVMWQTCQKLSEVTTFPQMSVFSISINDLDTRCPSLFDRRTMRPCWKKYSKLKVKFFLCRIVSVNEALFREFQTQFESPSIVWRGLNTLLQKIFDEHKVYDLSLRSLRIRYSRQCLRGSNIQ